VFTARYGLGVYVKLTLAVKGLIRQHLMKKESKRIPSIFNDESTESFMS
jgi:hypothetical protein